MRVMDKSRGDIHNPRRLETKIGIRERLRGTAGAEVSCHTSMNVKFFFSDGTIKSEYTQTAEITRARGAAENPERIPKPEVVGRKVATGPDTQDQANRLTSHLVYETAVAKPVGKPRSYSGRTFVGAVHGDFSGQLHPK